MGMSTGDDQGDGQLTMFVLLINAINPGGRLTKQF
jgi:hypothetical protein